MITAHLPAGYLLARALPPRRGLMATVLAASLLPDIDLVWYFLVDNRTNHHLYWVHIPGFWLAVGLVVLPLLHRFRPRALPYAAAALAALLLHIVLDSLVGGIAWLWPVSDHLYRLFTVRYAGGHWIFTYLMHWTILAELAIWLAAALVFLRDRRLTPAPAAAPARQARRRDRARPAAPRAGRSSD